MPVIIHELEIEPRVADPNIQMQPETRNAVRSIAAHDIERLLKRNAQRRKRLEVE